MKTKEEIIYSGPYKELFEGYILYKQSLGFQLEYREKRQLFNLNKFLNQYNTETVIITETMANEYIHTVKRVRINGHIRIYTETKMRNEPLILGFFFID